MRRVLHLMGNLTDEDVEWLAMEGKTRFIPRNTTIIEQGKSIDTFFVLLEGKLSVNTARLRDQPIATLYPGEVLGEISFVDARPPSASVIAIEDSHLLVLPRDVLTKRLARDDGFAARFYRGIAVFLADRLRTTTAHLGYGKPGSEEDPALDAIDERSFEEISHAARRFDQMLKRLRLTDGSAVTHTDSQVGSGSPVRRW